LKSGLCALKAGALPLEPHPLAPVLFLLTINKYQFRPGLVAYACNPGYSDREQEDQSSKPAWENSFRDPIWKIPNIIKGVGGVA
jgi:hypothetical protein